MSQCQTVWIQTRPDILSGLIWIQTVRKGYQQRTLVEKVLINQISKMNTLPIMSQYSHVSIQIIALCKSFPASFTNIWTMSSVYSLVSCKMGLTCKCLITYAALKCNGHVCISRLLVSGRRYYSWSGFLEFELWHQIRTVGTCKKLHAC